MREILFRGKRVDNGEWVEGWLMNEHIIPKEQEFTVECRNPQYFVDTDKLELYEIIPSTIGQYTGLTDKNGKRIFEHDIVRIAVCGMYDNYVISYDNENASFVVGDTSFSFWSYISTRIEIVGNIYDSPDLIKA